MSESNRFVRIHCPYCDGTSPILDQVADVRRTAIGLWWRDHRIKHVIDPTIEAVPSPNDAP